MPPPVLVMHVIYHNPSDHPGKWVVRPRHISPGRDEPMALCYVCDNLEEARTKIPAGLHCLPRYPQDDPVIYEVWF